MPPENDEMFGSQFKDQELIDLFSDLPGETDETPPTTAATPPAVDPGVAPNAAPADPTPEAAPVAPEGAEVETPAATPATPETPAQTPIPADGGVPPQPEIEVPEFETVEEAREWAKTQEKRRRDLESYMDKRDRGYKEQLTHQQQQMLAMQQQLGGVMQNMTQPAQEQITQEDVQQAVAQRPDETALWLDQNVPDALPYALAQIAEQHGLDQMARVQDVLFRNRLAAQQQAAYDAQMEQQAPQMLAQAFNQVGESVRDDVGAAQFDAVSDEVGRLCKEHIDELTDPQRNPTGVTPESLRRFITKQYIAADRNRTARAASAPLAPRELTPGEGAPAGVAGPGTTPGPNTGDDDVDDMVAFQQSRQISLSD